MFGGGGKFDGCGRLPVVSDDGAAASGAAAHDESAGSPEPMAAPRDPARAVAARWGDRDCAVPDALIAASMQLRRVLHVLLLRVAARRCSRAIDSASRSSVGLTHVPSMVTHLSRGSHARVCIRMSARKSARGSRPSAGRWRRRQTDPRARWRRATSRRSHRRRSLK